jgi:Zn-dependent protease with chaperone function
MVVLAPVGLLVAGILFHHRRLRSHAPWSSTRATALSCALGWYFVASFSTLGGFLVLPVVNAGVVRVATVHRQGDFTFQQAQTYVATIEWFAITYFCILPIFFYLMLSNTRDFYRNCMLGVDNAARSGELTEHVGKDIPWVRRLLLAFFGFGLSTGLWLSALLAALLCRRVYLALESGITLEDALFLASKDRSLLLSQNLHPSSVVVYGPLVPVVLTLVLLALRGSTTLWFFIRRRRSLRRRLSLPEVIESDSDFLSKLPDVLRRRVVFSVVNCSEFGAASFRHGLSRRKYLIVLTRALWLRLQKTDRDVVLAHEVAHCLLGHHERVRRCRILSLFLFLDPGLLTALLNSPAMEEEADAMACELLGGGSVGAKQMTTTFTTLEGYVPPNTNLHRVVTELAFDGRTPSREAPRGFLSEAFAGFRQILLNDHVLYEHPSFRRRIEALQATSPTI